MPKFEVVSEFAPAGDQPTAVAQLAEGITRGDRYQTLLGITGSGKSATVAWTIEQVQKPTLVLAPNKSLAAQLANEMREFFPKNRVEYFVSYYDYYQPEAYIPSSDTYIEKDSSINDEIDQRTMLRQLVDMNYERNDANLVRGKFRVRGDTIELHPAYEEFALRIELFGDDIERIAKVDTLTG